MVSEEMDFIQAYIYLIKTRFEENIRFNIDVPATARKKMLPPLTIQMLMENAIKHNVITEKQPLEISLREDGDYLVVENTLNKSSEESTSGTGLSNIRRRYAHFTSKPVHVTEAGGKFEVRVPLLEIEHS
jgi:LytS/YehU family sensor histidine kinase